MLYVTFCIFEFLHCCLKIFVVVFSSLLFCNTVGLLLLHLNSVKMTLDWLQYLNLFLTRVDGLRRRISLPGQEEVLDYALIRDAFQVCLHVQMYFIRVSMSLTYHYQCHLSNIIFLLCKF